MSKTVGVNLLLIDLYETIKLTKFYP
ncbi:protein of unknown function [Moritella yayanosii]|uniref:Uncharacterized protein n=1 Tax=Moritella yayanosii TaxID=69539 RepID=A0A330LQQ5_9GAMM|nr:protein of unknown function [Moritella yayanosii]